MSRNDAQLIEKVANRERDLVTIYQKVYPTLKGANRDDLPAKVVVALDGLEPPETIEPAKAAAVLQSIRGATFEYCYGKKMPDGTSLGSYVEREIKQLGLEYHDFWPYLRDRGWLNREDKPDV